MHIPVPPKVVFEALDSSRGRASFWAESAVEENGYVHFRFVNGVSYRSRMLQRQPPEVHSVEYFGGIARFELTDDGAGGTDLLLIHEGVSPDEWYDVHAGWLNILFPLKAFVTHGVDLRKHDPKRVWDRAYADQ